MGADRQTYVWNLSDGIPCRMTLSYLGLYIWHSLRAISPRALWRRTPGNPRRACLQAIFGSTEREQ